MGCDLEVIEQHSDAFATDYFTTEEQALIANASAADRLQLLALLWSGKESMLKTLGVGLRLDTRSVIVNLEDGLGSRREVPETYAANTWHPLHVTHTNDQILHGWWLHSGELLRTVIADPAPGPPIPLQIPA